MPSIITYSFRDSGAPILIKGAGFNMFNYRRSQSITLPDYTVLLTKEKHYHSFLFQTHVKLDRKPGVIISPDS